MGQTRPDFWLQGSRYPVGFVSGEGEGEIQLATNKLGGGCSDSNLDVILEALKRTTAKFLHFHRTQYLRVVIVS